MDRFIVTVVSEDLQGIVDLKSNMDRFIELKKCFYNFIQEHLKSNMDRFIETK